MPGNDGMDVVLEMGDVRGGNSGPNVNIRHCRVGDEQPFCCRRKVSIGLVGWELGIYTGRSLHVAI